MTRGFRLATVLRIRRLEEDIARIEVARAQASAVGASIELRRREARLGSSGRPQDGTAAAFLATVAARAALAADLAAARWAYDHATDEVDARLAGWSESAARVRALETLEDRHRAAQRAAEERAAQAEVDDLSAAARRRQGAGGEVS